MFACAQHCRLYFALLHVDLVRAGPSFGYFGTATQAWPWGVSHRTNTPVQVHAPMSQDELTVMAQTLVWT